MYNAPMLTQWLQATPAEKFLLAVILLVGIVLRFGYLMQIEHNVDHAYPVWQALQTIDRGQFPVIGARNIPCCLPTLL